MSDETIKKVLAARDAARLPDDILRTIRDQSAQASAALKALEENYGVRRLIEDMNRHQDMIRAALGPVEELRRSGRLLDSALGFSREMELAWQIMGDFKARFRLPEIAEATKLFREFENSGAASLMRQFQEQSAEIERAMKAMRAPWLDVENKLQSIAGFVELQGIGLALQRFPAFDEGLADALRIDLGDWRAAISWPQNIFADVVARTAFYAERGLDPGLTSFPTEAFRQGVSIAGLTGAPPPLLKSYDGEAVEEQDDEEAGFERTNAAHNRLQRFETQLRRFIDEGMTAAFGQNWTKHNVPGPIRQRWLEKRQAARDNGEPELPLIAYADFSDYVPIITRKDNWETVFKRAFRRVEFVTESFHRLYPIRICTMHARLVTQDDELYLYVETKRVLAAIGIVL